jgi:hypothetical protein
MRTRSGLQLLARSGYFARGVVFVLVAGLALFSGVAASETGSALDTLIAQPFGRIWVGLIGIGLGGFVVWRLAQSLGNADNHPRDAKGMAVRAALLISALVYIGFAFHAFQQALAIGGSGGGNGGGGEKDLAAWTMSQPFGRYLAGLVGAGFVIGGIVTAAKGLLRKYERYLEDGAKDRQPVTALCMYGLAARGVLFVIVGAFFMYAAFTVDPAQAGSMKDALAWLRDLPFGGVLYTVMAVGLASFGAYNFIQSRYRIVRAPDLSAVKAPLSAAGRH